METKSAAIYARVSTLEQNPEAQLLALREYVQRRRFTIHREYVDHVTGNILKRARGGFKDQAYQDLMHDARLRSFDVVVVWKYDRFARSLQTLMEALQTFSCLGIDFISCTQDIDTTTAAGRLFYQIIGSFAEFEREIIVERTRAGLANARAKGTKLGRPRSIGVEQEIMKLREQGFSLERIAKKVKWSKSGVRNVLIRHSILAPHPSASRDAKEGVLVVG